MLTVCPVCRQRLDSDGKSCRCENGHCFDYAKEGYLNLLLGRRAGAEIGDNRDMAVSRQSFLSKGYYSALSDALCDVIPKYKDRGTLLDICCGEGYYTACLAEKLTNMRICGFDISKEMVRLAAKRKCIAEFFVANMTCIPVPDESVDAATHLFAPFCAAEFSRVLKKDGVLLSVVSGEKHLLSLKEALYDRPYLNDEAPPEADGFILKEKIKICDEITVNGGDIMSLLKMTPYFYHTPTEGLNRLSAMQTLTTPVEFVIFVYKKA